MSKMNETTTGAGPTAGPWRVVGEEWIKADATHGRGGECCVVAQAVSGTDSVSLAERDANARLIAASPTMLQALRAAKKALADILDNHPDVWPTGGLKEAQTPERRAWRKRIEGYRDAARAAIRAAELKP